MLDSIALWLGYIILFGALSCIACILWAFVLISLQGLVVKSFRSIKFYYRFLCWHKCKDKVEAWLSTEEGRLLYDKIKNDSEYYQHTVNKNDAALDTMFNVD